MFFTNTDEGVFLNTKSCVKSLHVLEKIESDAVFNSVVSSKPIVSPADHLLNAINGQNVILNDAEKAFVKKL